MPDETIADDAGNREVDRSGPPRYPRTPPDEEVEASFAAGPDIPGSE